MPAERNANGSSFSLVSWYFDCTISCDVFALLCDSIKYTTEDLTTYVATVTNCIWAVSHCVTWSCVYTCDVACICFHGLNVERPGLSLSSGTLKELLVIIFLLFILTVQWTCSSTARDFAQNNAVCEENKLIWDFGNLRIKWLHLSKQRFRYIWLMKIRLKRQ